MKASAVAAMLRGFPQEFFGDPVCAAQRRREAGREALDVWLGDAPAAVGVDADGDAGTRQLAHGAHPLDVGGHVEADLHLQVARAAVEEMVRVRPDFWVKVIETLPAGGSPLKKVFVDCLREAGVR